MATLTLKHDERAGCLDLHSLTEKQKALIKVSLLQRVLHWASSLDGMMVVLQVQKKFDLMVVGSAGKMVVPKVQKKVGLI